MKENTLLTDRQTDRQSYIISVVVPIYNREKLIKKTVCSLLTQPCANELEIILVNDGSTDNTQLVCEEYEHDYSNVRFINKENGGVSSARNVGIENATGKYIAFLDCDDWWNENFFSKDIVEKLKSNSFDLYGFSYCVTNITCQYKRTFHIEEKTCFWKDNQYGRFTKFPHCSILFLRDFLKDNIDLRYPNIDYREDICFCERCFFLAKSYQSFDKSIFTYWLNVESIIHTINSEKRFDNTYKSELINKEWFNQKGIGYSIDYSVCVMFTIYVDSLCCEKKYKEVKKIINNDIRLKPVWDYKNLNLERSYCKKINKWIEHPLGYYINIRLTKRPLMITKDFIQHNNCARTFTDYIIYKLLLHYDKI